MAPKVARMTAVEMVVPDDKGRESSRPPRSGRSERREPSRTDTTVSEGEDDELRRDSKRGALRVGVGVLVFRLGGVVDVRLFVVQTLYTALPTPLTLVPRILPVLSTSLRSTSSRVYSVANTVNPRSPSSTPW
jgi:hypothetical protein